MNQYADMRASEEEDEFKLEIDATLELKDLNGEVVAGINQLKPFGRGNPEPVFQATGVKVVEGPTVLKDQHLVMTLNQEGHVFRAIAWQSAHRREFLLGLGGEIDVAYSIMENHFRGESTVQLSVADVREAR
jgi:single-stranded-DNA-specific exonuclease